MSVERQKDRPMQMALAWLEEGRSEAPRASMKGTETLAAEHGIESPADTEKLMEEVCERENCLRALKQVKANKGSAGADGMTVTQLPGYLKQALAGHPGTVADRALSAATGDRVNHDKLMAAVARRVADKRMPRLIRAFLTAGVMENGLVGTTEEGTP